MRVRRLPIGISGPHCHRHCLRDTRYLDVVRHLYSDIDAPVLATDITTAEMIKYASNAILATRISFMNEIAEICDRVGASIDDVSKGLALDSRSGARIFPGVGYGGPCLPKDIGALEHLARQLGTGSGLIVHHWSQRAAMATSPLHALRHHFGGKLHGLKVAIFGLSFQARYRRFDRGPGGEADPGS